MLLAVTDISPAIVGIGLLLIGAILVLVLLHAARFPLQTLTGRAIIAGSIAGLLLGPSVLGRVMPDLFESMFVGGADQREDLEYARWLGANAPLALANLTEQARQALRERGAAEVAQKQTALEAARWAQQRPTRIAIMLVVALAMLASAGRAVRVGDRRQGWVTSVTIGLWSFALPAALAYMCAMRWWETNAGEAAMLAAAVGVGPWALSGIEREVADGAEFGGARMMQTAGRIASMLAMALAMWAAWSAPGGTRAAVLTPLAALPAAWAVDFIRRPDDSAAVRPSRSAWLTTVQALLAVLAALVAIKVDVHALVGLAALGAMIILGLLADDGRLIGAVLGAMLMGGRRMLRTMRLVMPSMAAGPTQLGVAALALHGGLLPERFAAPLLLGVVLIELTAPARRNMAMRLIETERAIETEAADDV